MSGRLDGLVALVTGGGSGVGRAIAVAFAREGAAVGIVGRREDKLAETIHAVESVGGRGLALPGDVVDEGRMSAVIAELRSTFGRIDVLVNNAAAYHPKPLLETPVEEWDVSMSANVRAPYRLACLVFEELARHRGSVLNISSTLALRPVPGCASYSVSKAALDMLTRVMALEWAAKGVRANGLLLGIVDTPIHEARAEDDPAAWRQAVDGMHPIGRIGQPTDVAELAVFLSSSAAGWITGSLYTVDGGISLV